MWQSWGSRRWVVRFCGSATRFPFLMPSRLSNVPIPLPSFSPSCFRGFALSTAVAGLHAKGALAPSHLFMAVFFCLSWLWLLFSSYLCSSFCRALLLFFLVHIPPSWGFLRLSWVSLWPLVFPCASLSYAQSFRVVTNDHLFC